tara:strand:- start:279 stop:1691 length:1413 start_codon:yes stop_codon:yes gene_type:complete
MLNKLEYKKLCKVCDLIIENSTSISRNSISYLHIIRPHHIDLKKYQIIFSESNARFFLNSLTKFLKVYLNFIVSFLKISFNSKSNFKKTINVDIFFVSHLFNKNQLSNNQDLYFYNLSEDLNSKSLKVNRIFIKHTKQKIDSKDNFIIGNLSIVYEIKIRLLQIKEFLVLLYSSIFDSNCSLEKRVKIQSSIDCLSYSTLSNLRVYFYIKKLVKQYSPKLILTTYEGHAYERLIYKAINSCKSTISSGYQHSAVFKHQHSILKNRGGGYDPNFIFTSGKITHKIFSNYFDKKKLFELGSSRGSLFANRELNASNILVIPEGLIDDVDVFISLIKSVSKKIKNFQFIIRFHPSIPKKIIQKRKESLKDIKHIIFSNSSLKEDILKSNYVLYRGSTAVFSSVISGLTPIYYDLNEIDLNPLFELKESIQYVNEPEDFANIVEDDLATKTKNKTYCKKYFTDFNSLSILNLIN